MNLLVYVNELGPNYRGDNIYEFIFSDSDISTVCGDNWEIKPSNGYPLPPYIQFISNIAVMKSDVISMSVIQNSDCFSMIDAQDGIIALAWENENTEVDFDLDKRLFFRFGEDEKSVINKLKERGIVLEFEKQEK